jgi:hypothetical protein
MISGLLVGALCAVLPALSAATPTRPVHPSLAHPSHPVHPARSPRPTRTPRDGGTPVVVPTPTPVVRSCPALPSHQLGARVTKLFYAYPGTQRNLRASGFFDVDFLSNGLNPPAEQASLTLTNDDGDVILGMPDLRFSDTGKGSFAASNEQGYVSIRKFGGSYAFDFSFDKPNFAPDFFEVRMHLCLNIGDDGFRPVSIVCQKKPRGGFLCHQ